MRVTLIKPYFGRLLCLILAIFPLTAAIAQDNAPGKLSPTPADKPSKQANPEIKLSGLGLSLHKPSYILPVTWISKKRNGENFEFKYQFSLKQQIFKSDWYFAYSQKALWQIYDGANSRPFREVNHNPELFWRRRPKENHWGNFGFDLGAEHESNGRSGLESRSWDRLFARFWRTEGRFRGDFKVWYRIPEDRKTDPSDPRGDDNPDIEDFLGYGDISMRYQWPNSSLLRWMIRYNPATGHGASEMEVSFLLENRFFLMLQWFSGYGDSLIDYDQRLDRIGIGIAFKR